MKRIPISWSEVLEGAPGASASDSWEEGEFEIASRETLRQAADDALRDAYEGLEGEFVLDLDGV